MRSPNAVSMAIAGFFVVVQISACSSSTQPPGPPDEVFLSILTGPLRDRFSDSDLLAEGKKVCDARAQGQSWDQLAEMAAKDLNLTPGEAGQFMGGLDGGLCTPTK